MFFVCIFFIRLLFYWKKHTHIFYRNVIYFLISQFNIQQKNKTFMPEKLNETMCWIHFDLFIIYYISCCKSSSSSSSSKNAINKSKKWKAQIKYLNNNNINTQKKSQKKRQKLISSACRHSFTMTKVCCTQNLCASLRN